MAILNREVESPEVGDVKTVYLEAGEFMYIAPEILTACFKQTPKHRKLENAEIVVEELPVRLRCNGCGTEREAENGGAVCDGCGSDKSEVVSGKEFNIKGIEW